MPENKNQNARLFKRFMLILGRIDYMQLVPMILLIIIGEFFIYGTGQQVGSDVALSFWKKQLVWIAMGLLLWLVLTFINYRTLGQWSWFIYVASIISLVLVLIVGLKIYGARRWLQIGPLRLQPSEFAKFAVLITVSWVLSLRDFNVNRIYHLFAVGLLAALPFFLIVIEPDLGSSLVIVPLTAVLLFAARINWKFILLGFFLVFAALPAVYPFLKDYQKERIFVFIDPDRDPKNRGWNQRQAELAVGSGGRWGKGFMQSTQNTLGFLPQSVSNTDFIFSVIAEETGFFGSVSLVVLYALLVLSALKTALLARDDFGRFLAVGIAAIIFTHSVVNIGMSIRLMPVTGLPLPLISYGGSFMLSTMIYLGILQSVYAHRNRFKRLD